MAPLKLKDPIALGIVAGLAGSVAKEITDRISVGLGLSRPSYLRMAAGVYLKNADVRTKMGESIGILADMALGAGFGVGLVYVLKFTGKDHSFIKGVGYSHGVWTLFMGGTNKLTVSKAMPQKPASILSKYISHTAYGLAASMVATALGDKDMFRKEDITAEMIPDAVE